MKQVILIVFLSFMTALGFAQTGNLLSFYGGAGLATSDNYDAGLSGGFEFLKGIGERTALGATVFYQSYGVYHDNEAYGAKNDEGNAGATLLNKSSYIFLAPKISHGLGRHEYVKVYVDGGAGFNMGGTETLHKFDKSYGAAVGNYDSTINTSSNINKLIFRFGIGLTEYIHLSGKWWFTVTEDYGFITKNLSTTADYDSPERTPYTPNNLRPDYFSLQIGVSHSKH